MPELEICCDNYASALIAAQAGADRVELCSSLGEGGVTPSYGFIEQAVSDLDTDIHVLIRPRGGDFLYKLDEINIIKKDIEACKKIGVDGIVIGFLNSDGSIDKKLTQEIIALAKPLKITFHRAIDMCAHPINALEELIQLGVDYVLTSGQADKAIDGVSLIKQMVDSANGKIKIMPGSGVRTHLLQELYQKTKAPAYHMSARIKIESEMMFRKKNVSMGSKSIESEYQTHSQDFQKIKQAKAILKSLV